MAILMTLEVPADSDKLVQYSKDNPDALLKILERAKTHGVISHKFFASGGDVLVVDEWPLGALGYELDLRLTRAAVSPKAAAWLDPSMCSGRLVPGGLG